LKQVTLDLTIFGENENTIVAEICEGETYEVGNSTYTTTGIYTNILTTAAGCDSTVTLDLTVYPNAALNIPVIICEGESHFAAGANQTTTGIYIDSLTTIFGCDSIVTTNLTVLPVSLTNLEDEICENDIYTFAGVQLTESGTYADTLTAVNGCDSIVTLELNVLPEAIVLLPITVCEGTGYEFGNQTYFDEGIYEEVFNSSNGCDSTVTLVLTVTDEIIENVEETICAYESFEFGGEILTESGLYSDTLIAVAGCDSIVNLDLNVLFAAESTLNATICIGDIYTLGNTDYQTPGIYEQTFIASSGCDSIVTLNLSVVPNFQLPISATLCANEHFQVGDSLYYQSGIYIDTLSSITGCDSIIMLNLNILPYEEETIEVTICAGEIYQVGNNAYNTTGTYSDTLTSINGCDSITNLVLQVSDVQPTVVYQDLCEGDTIILEGAYQTTGGVFTDILQSSNGCDSLIYTYVTLLDNATTYMQEVICDGDSIFIAGEFRFEAGEFTEHYNTFEGCDSIVITELLIDPPTDIYVEGLDLCLGEEGQLFVEGADVVTWSPTVGLSCDNCPNPMVSPSSTTTYKVSAASCLGTTVETSVTVYVSAPPELVVSDDETILLGESAFMMASTDDIQDVVTWTDGIQTICGCAATEEITIKVNEACQYSRLEIPNMISPNGDGYNDRFEIRHEGFGKISLLKVYNRWGEVIYETNDINQSWDGTFKGAVLNPGVYVYYLEGYCLNDESFIRTGNVTILK